MKRREFISGALAVGMLTTGERRTGNPESLPKIKQYVDRLYDGYRRGRYPSEDKIRQDLVGFIAELSDQPFFIVTSPSQITHCILARELKSTRETEKLGDQIISFDQKLFSKVEIPDYLFYSTQGELCFHSWANREEKAICQNMDWFRQEAGRIAQACARADQPDSDFVSEMRSKQWQEIYQKAESREDFIRETACSEQLSVRKHEAAHLAGEDEYGAFLNEVAQGNPYTALARIDKYQRDKRYSARYHNAATQFFAWTMGVLRWKVNQFRSPEKKALGNRFESKNDFSLIPEDMLRRTAQLLYNHRGEENLITHKLAEQL